MAGVARTSAPVVAAGGRAVLKTSRRTLKPILISSVALALLIRIADALALGGLIAIALRETPEILKHRLIPTLTVIFALCFAAAWASRRPALTSTVGYSFIDLALAGVMILVIMASTYSRFLSSLQ